VSFGDRSVGRSVAGCNIPSLGIVSEIWRLAKTSRPKDPTVQQNLTIHCRLPHSDVIRLHDIQTVQWIRHLRRVGSRSVISDGSVD